MMIGILFSLTLMFASAAESNYCCEKTTAGAWCQNAPQSVCDTSFKTAPTSCDSTSYCKKGCCFDGNEGLCMEGTPQKVCEDSSGTWADNEKCDVPQCNLGCCVLADQGAFVTLTRCKQMSGFYGIKTDFRTTITNELSCIATAQSADKGACVFEDSALLEKSCVFTTRANCNVANLASDVLVNNSEQNFSTGSGFYKDYLCTAPELGTECAPDLKNTITLEGKDEVYFQDTCGNVANIYDASKAKDNAYWTKVYKKSESCGYGDSNAGSTTCGNCDYFLGSIAKKSTGILGIGDPAYGDYICADLSCAEADKSHGESWCAKDEPSGDGKDTVGSRYYREICIMGEVITEPCADYRNEICIEDTFNGFSEAQCRVNRWQDCTKQKEDADCSNTLARDCKWIEGYYFSSNTGQIEKAVDDQTEYGQLHPTPQGLCVPNYPPGSNFWGASETGGFDAATPEFNATTPGFGTGYISPSSDTIDSSVLCGLANMKIVVQFNKTTKPADIFGLFSGNEEWECGNDACERYVSNPSSGIITEAEVQAIATDMNGICSTLGDCGGKTNWVGQYTDDGYAAYLLNKRLAGSGGAEVLESDSSSNAAMSTATTGSTGTSGSDIASTATAVSTLANTAGQISGEVVADIDSSNPIQFRIIIDYFKNMFGIAGN